MPITLLNTDNVTDNGGIFAQGTTGLTTAVVGTTTYLFVAGSTDNGVSVFSVGDDGTVTNVANAGPGLFLGGAHDVLTAVVGGVTYLFVAGQSANGISVFSVGTDGSLVNVENEALADPIRMSTATVGGNSYLFVSQQTANTEKVFSIAANGLLTQVDSVTDNATLELFGADRSTTAVVGGTTYLFVAGRDDNGVSVFSVAADGSLTNAANVTDDATMHLADVRGLVTAAVAGTTYLFTAGQNDSGVSVFSVAADGSLTNVANVDDDATLELAGATGLATAVVQGVTYLSVTGLSDAGVSVFSVAAGGSLTNVANVSDNATLKLQGAIFDNTAFAAGLPYLFVAGQSDNGFSVFSLTGQPPAAVNDAVATPENITLSSGDAFANNGSGPDTDPEADLFSVIKVNGSTANVGSAIALASGALVTLNANGTFSYNPNHIFDKLPDLATSGASNTQATDSFTYTIAGGSAATVTVTVNGADSDDLLYGTAGVDILNGGIGNDFILGFAGADDMTGGVGNDWYLVDDPGDVVHEAGGGGTLDRVFAHGDFTLPTGAEIENFSTDDHAGTGPISLTGNALANLIYGNAGDNTLNGLDGADTLIGLGGNDTLNGGALGDILIGGTGDDHLNGNDGADLLYGGTGTDTLTGGAGDDWYFVDDASAILVEAAGEGTLDRVFASVSYTLTTGAEIERFSTNDHGGTAALDLIGNALVNVICGNAGANTLNGKAGNDLLVGLGGADTFAFDTSLDGATNVDRIADYTVGVDHIRLDRAIFSALGAGGTLAAAEFFTGAAAHDGDDHVIYNAATGALLYDADGLNGDAAVAFATLKTGLALTNADFLLT